MKADRRPIDWAAVRDRLERSRAALNAALTVTPEKLDAVYQERAVALAARQRRAAGPSGTHVLVFALGADRYALDFGDVAEVLPFAACTPVPGGPPELLGVMNVRGDIRSVIDLGRVLGLPAAPPEGGYVLVIRRHGSGACLRVDAIDHIRLVPPDELLAPPDGIDFPLLAGVTRDRVKLLKTGALVDQTAADGDPHGHREIG